ATPGDGIGTAGAGTFTVTGSHTYAEDTTASGALPFSLTVRDAGGASAGTAASVGVTDAALHATPTAVSATEGAGTGVVTVATFTDADPAGTAGDYSASIAWGDGTATPGSIVDLGVT